MSKRPFIIACIPAFREEASIARVIVKALKYADKVIVCDDGSPDMTGEIAERLGAEVIRHERNLGYGAAICSLFRRVRELDPDVMVTLDADLQHDPDEIPKVVSPILRGEADIVVGSRFLAEDSGSVPRHRRVGIRVITGLVKAFSYEEISDAQSGFRAYSRIAVRSITPTEYGMGVSTEILLKAKEKGLKIKEVPIRIDYKVKRPSTHNPLYHGLDVILSLVKHMSIRHPLIFYGIPGAASLLTAIAFWIWTFHIFATTHQVITNIALIAIGATIVGLMLLTTAVILWVLVSVVREMR
ncbi:glycosyltransferase family 2 protein [Candidatus Bathyarchaeota archaeon]|nr:glycosyltransferase family 2 protein [Candidatus Bathyarchaeota archaeon]